MKISSGNEKAPPAGTVKALSVNTQPIKEGFNMIDSKAVQVSSQPTFSFGDNKVRVIVRDGEPWFVASDVCGALDYKNTSKAIGDHLDDDEKGLTTGYTLGGEQKLTVISESGLYALVLRSRKPEARKFAKWVTSEVLPAIRKTDAYGGNPQYQRVNPLNAPEMTAARKVAEEYFDNLRAAVNAGKPSPAMGEVPQEVLQGIMARAVVNQRTLTWFDWETGSMHCKLVPSDASVFSMTSGDYSELLEHVPMDRLPQMAEAINKRVACHLGAFKQHLQRSAKSPLPGALYLAGAVHA